MCSMAKVDIVTPWCYTDGQENAGGAFMTSSSKLCKALIESSPMLQKEVAEKMGWSLQTLSNKFRRNTLSADEFFKMIDILEYDMKLIKKNDGVEIRAPKRGVGERLKMVVRGIKYDTYKADAICHTEESNGMFSELYRDYQGRYFVAHYVKWENGVSSISPIDEDDAKAMIANLE